METITHDGRWIQSYEIINPLTGKPYEGVRRKGEGTVVGALVENVTRNTLILVEQYRPLLERNVIECVGGLVEVGDSPEDSIAREIREETGYTAKTIERLLAGPKSAGLTSETTTEYFVEVFGNPEKQKLEESEAGLKVHEIPSRLPVFCEYLQEREQDGVLVSPSVWGNIGKAIAEGKIMR